MMSLSALHGSNDIKVEDGDASFNNQRVDVARLAPGLEAPHRRGRGERGSQATHPGIIGEGINLLSHH